jgi:mitotic spindle assembly checkpoint protein MAD2
MATATATKNTITLKGSTETVAEFFQYALSSILYQRGVYPAENFEPQKKYGLTVMAVQDPKLSGYLQSVLRQFSGASAAAQGRLRRTHDCRAHVGP